MLKRFLIALPLVLLALVLIDRASLVSAPCITAVGNQANERDNGKEERCTKREGIVVAGLETLKDIPAEWFTAFASIAIALFTFTLWRSTDRLWKAGESQIDSARESADASKKVADATQLQAEALVATSQNGRVAIATVGLWDAKGINKVTAAVPPPEFTILLVPHNIGRAPVTLDGFYLDWIVGDKQAAEPTYKTHFDESRDLLEGGPPLSLASTGPSQRDPPS